MNEFAEHWRDGREIPHFVDTVVVRKDGVRVPIEVAFSMLNREESVVAIAFLRDISDRKRAEQALRESEARIRQMIEAAPDAVTIVRDGRIVFANPSFLRMLGYDPAEDVRGRSMAEFLHPDDRGPLTERLREMVQTGKGLPPYEYRGIGRDGQTVFAEVVSIPFQFDGARCILGFARELTERKQMQAKLLQTDRMATIGTVAAGVAHEINNPLSYALLNLDFLTRQLPVLIVDPTQREQIMSTLAAVREGSQRVATIVRDLRSFSRSSSDELELVDVGQILDSSINIAMSEIRGRARLVREYASVRPVRASPAWLGQVFLNLVLNAAHALAEGDPEENALRVSVLPLTEDKVMVEVADNGPGIPPAILGRVFEPFFTTKAAGVGTGLGLAICQSIVTSMGGELSVESTLVRGDIFRVVLPAPAKFPSVERIPRSVQGPSDSSGVGQRRRVLVIDDEPKLGQALARFLGGAHEVTLVFDGREALAMLLGPKEFDAILCDLLMPNLSGMELHAELLARRPLVARRIIFMTGAASMTKVADFFARVDNPKIDKPLDLQRLLMLLSHPSMRASAT
jgi:PAS domain S-box-containing protein